MSKVTTDDRLLTPQEVATMFRVDPKTVTRWAKAGKLTSIRTLGGHRRYHEAEVLGLIANPDRPRPPCMYDVRPGQRIRHEGTIVLVHEVTRVDSTHLLFSLGLDGSREITVVANAFADLIDDAEPAAVTA